VTVSPVPKEIAADLRVESDFSSLAPFSVIHQPFGIIVPTPVSELKAPEKPENHSS
jgi:hypothetical protein